MINDCEMVEKNLCLGCVGLAENNWSGKYKCKNYQQLRQKKEGSINGYSCYNRFNNRNIYRNDIYGNVTNK